MTKLADYDSNLGSLEAMQGNSGYAGPLLGRKRLSLAGPNEATLQHEAFLAWLESDAPQWYHRHRIGEYVSEREWQEWIATWRTAQ